MGVPLIEELLTGDSNEIRDIAKNEAVLVGFLTLAKGVDDLPDMSTRFYEEPRSLYQVTGQGPRQRSSRVLALRSHGEIPWRHPQGSGPFPEEH